MNKSIWSSNTAILLYLAALTVFIYYPGLSGPYIFDDYPNLLGNSFVQITSLDAKSLKHAAYSLAAGPLQRPVSMLSFALNYYFAGGFDYSTPFKLTNLIIHILNGILLLWISRIVFTRLAQSNPNSFVSFGKNSRFLNIICIGVVTLWMVHPIQVTSVLYVVQRMASLSAFFVLLGILFYLKGRLLLLSGNTRGAWLILFGLLGCGVPGVLSKENAFLLPIFMLVLELVLFSNEFPLQSWNTLSRKTKGILLAGIGILLLIVLIKGIQYSLPWYAYRKFNMAERLFTESRVLFFYISLILVPRINKFGIFHDDIEISKSLIDPWTTLPSVTGIVFMFLIAVIKYRQWPLFSLGILWFLTSHLMESTIFPLEIAHEHRNYLASFGVFLTLTHTVDRGSQVLLHRKLWLVLPLLAITFSTITFFRATQWADPVSIFQYEALHNPDSSSAQAGLGMRLIQYQQYDAGVQALRRASELEPNEASYLINIYMSAAQLKKVLPDTVHDEILNRLRNGNLTATTIWSIKNVGECILTTCASLSHDMETWLRILLERTASGEYDASLFQYLLARSLLGQGKFDQAVPAYKESIRLDPYYLHPMIELGYVYIRLGKFGEAESLLIELRRKNKSHKHPQDNEIEKLDNNIQHYKNLSQKKSPK